MMKKLILIVFSLCIAVSLLSCKNKESEMISAVKNATTFNWLNQGTSNEDTIFTVKLDNISINEAIENNLNQEKISFKMNWQIDKEDEYGDSVQLIIKVDGDESDYEMMLNFQYYDYEEKVVMLSSASMNNEAMMDLHGDDGIIEVLFNGYILENKNSK